MPCMSGFFVGDASLMQDQDDTNCVSLIRRGGQARREGVAILYGRYAGQFQRYYRRNRVPEDHIEDVVQDAFIGIVRACGGFRGDCDIRLWLWKIARNAMMSYFRRLRPVGSLEDTPGADERMASAPDETPGDSIEECVQSAFRQFAGRHPERAEVLRLSTIEGWSIAELAAFLSRTLGATREYVSQCRKRFRPYLDLCRDYL